MGNGMILYLVRYNPFGQGGQPRAYDLTNGPCPTILAHGLAGDTISHCWIVEAADAYTAIENVIKRWELWQAGKTKNRRKKRG